MFYCVALLAEGVDRNRPREEGINSLGTVALLAEGVDRNSNETLAFIYMNVALLAEGVDRNCTLGLHI